MLYTATGSVKLKSCSDFKVVQLYSVPFGLNSVVYIKQKAMKGIMEKIAIKRINMVGNVFNYCDSTNRVWLEHELVWQADALPLAIAYWEDLERKILAQPCI